MLFFKSKYDKLKREDIVNAICELEFEETNLENDVIEIGSKINKIMQQCREEKNNQIKLLFAKKIMHLQEDANLKVNRCMYLMYNITLMERLKDAIDDKAFFKKTNSVSFGKLLSDQKGLAKFLNEALDVKIKSENVLTEADELWNEINHSYEKNQSIYGISKNEDELLAMFEINDDLLGDKVINEDNKLIKIEESNNV